MMNIHHGSPHGRGREAKLKRTFYKPEQLDELPPGTEILRTGLIPDILTSLFTKDSAGYWRSGGFSFLTPKEVMHGKGFLIWEV